MKHNLKTLGLALGAMLALGALLAAGASAAGERFHSTEENVIVTGESKVSLFRVGKKSTTEGLKVSCKTAKYEGTVKGEEFESGTETWTSKEVTVHPTYKECEVEGLGAATVDTDGCDYILTSEYNVQETEGGHKDAHAPVEVECTHGDFIEITATGCTIRIGTPGATDGDIKEETLTTGVTYTNKGEGHNKTVTVNATVDSIPYTSEKFLCVFAGIAHEGHDGFYEDDVLVQGTEDLDIDEPCVHNEITHMLEECNEGEEVGIWWE